MNLNIHPFATTNNVPIVFCTDDDYVFPLAVAIQSIIAHSTANNYYDILVLKKELNPQNEDLILNLIKEIDNISIRFIDISTYINLYPESIFFKRAQFKAITYYRFLIPDLLNQYNKILYLDSDLVIIDDVAVLYNESLDNNLLAAAPDILLVQFAAARRNTSCWNIPFDEYATRVLKMDDCSKYFQAGVMLLNLKELREYNFKEKFIQELKRIEKPPFVDQDVFNAVCYGKVKFLNLKWNHMYFIHDSSIFAGKVPKHMIEEFNYSYERNMSILHCAGPIKPWADPSQKFADIFWKYARMTPFYEQILYKNITKI